MKFSIVTPAHNSERFIAETIESVISQKGDFSIEFIIMDNCSTDGTLSIVEEYQRSVKSGARKPHCHSVEMKLVSEPDLGMYDAINKGFALASGDVHAWINSDDIYLPGAFSVVQRTLEAFPEISWIKGITSYIDENSTIYSVGKCNLYLQEWIRDGMYGPVLYFIQQDSVFWRSGLWGQVKNEISDYFLAGDYFIWRQFARNYALYSLNAYVSCFRKVPGQKSETIDKYWDEALAKNDLNEQLARKIRISNRLSSHFPNCMRPVLCKLIYGGQSGHLVLPGDSMSPVLTECSPEELNKILS